MPQQVKRYQSKRLAGQRIDDMLPCLSRTGQAMQQHHRYRPAAGFTIPRMCQPVRPAEPSVPYSIYYTMHNRYYTLVCGSVGAYHLRQLLQPALRVFMGALTGDLIGFVR